MTARAKYLLFTLLFFCPAQLLAQSKGAGKASAVFWGMLFAVAITLILAPILYRGSLRKKRAQKNMTAFLLNDPETRELLMESKTGKVRQKDSGDEEGDRSL